MEISRRGFLKSAIAAVATLHGAQALTLPFPSQRIQFAQDCGTISWCNALLNAIRECSVLANVSLAVDPSFIIDHEVSFALTLHSGPDEVGQSERDKAELHARALDLTNYVDGLGLDSLYDSISHLTPTGLPPSTLTQTNIFDFFMDLHDKMNCQSIETSMQWIAVPRWVWTLLLKSQAIARTLYPFPGLPLDVRTPSTCTWRFFGIQIYPTWILDTEGAVLYGRTCSSAWSLLIDSPEVIPYMYDFDYLYRGNLLCGHQVIRPELLGYECVRRG